MDDKILRSFLVSIFLYFLALSAPACSFSNIEKEIEFDYRSTALGVNNARKISDWFVKWRDGVGADSVLVVTTSIENDPRSLDISRERSKNIARLIDSLNTKNASIEFSDKDRVSASGQTAFIADLVVVSVQPSCAKTRSCCFEPPDK